MPHDGDWPMAATTQVFTCPRGCAVVMFLDQAGEPIAEGHLRPEMVERFITDLRQASADGVAMQRPLA
jgi:hypothetical protein